VFRTYWPMASAASFAAVLPAHPAPLHAASARHVGRAA